MSEREDEKPTSDEERLRGAFALLKATDRRRAPTFEASRTRRVRPVRIWLVAGPIAAAAAMLLLVCGLAGEDQTSLPVAAAPPAVVPPPPPTATVAATRPDPMPLDFLADDAFLSASGTRGFLAHAPDFDSDFAKGFVR